MCKKRFKKTCSNKANRLRCNNNISVPRKIKQVCLEQTMLFYEFFSCSTWRISAYQRRGTMAFFWRRHLPLPFFFCHRRSPQSFIDHIERILIIRIDDTAMPNLQVCPILHCAETMEEIGCLPPFHDRIIPSKRDAMAETPYPWKLGLKHIDISLDLPQEPQNPAGINCGLYRKLFFWVADLCADLL